MKAYFLKKKNFFCFGSRLQNAVQAGFKLNILLSQLLKCYDLRCAYHSWWVFRFLRSYQTLCLYSCAISQAQKQCGEKQGLCILNNTLPLVLTLNILIATESCLSLTAMSSVFHVLGCTTHMSPPTSCLSVSPYLQLGYMPFVIGCWNYFIV